MAKEMNVSCNFIEHKLTCILPNNTMDVLLKVRTKSGRTHIQRGHLHENSKI